MVFPIVTKRLAGGLVQGGDQKPLPGLAERLHRGKREAEHAFALPKVSLIRFHFSSIACSVPLFDNATDKGIQSYPPSICSIKYRSMAQDNTPSQETTSTKNELQ